LTVDLPNYAGILPAGPHRTLQAVIELTTDGLNDEEQRALAALTAFPPKANSFSDEAAIYVAQRKGYVRSLRASGLLELANPRGPRWSMHQAIVDAARDRTGPMDGYSRLVDFVIGWLEANADTTDPRWNDELESEFENVRAALEWTIDNGDGYRGLRLMADLWGYWYKENLFRRASHLAGRVLALPDADASEPSHRLLRAKVLNDAGNYAYNMAELTAAHTLHSEAREIRLALGREDLLAGSLNNLGLIDRERGFYHEAMVQFSDAVALNESSHHEKWILWTAMNHNNIGITLDRLSQFDDAAAHHRKSIELFDELEEPWGLAMARTDLAATLINLGARDKARDILLSILKDRWAAADDKRVAAAMRGLARISLHEGNGLDARDLLIGSLGRSIPITDRLGELAALGGLVVACASTDSREAITLGARAAGALHTYLRRDGARFSSWRQRTISGAQHSTRTRHPELFRGEFEAGRTAIAEGQLSPFGALGIDAVDDRIEHRLRDLIQSP
jgi:tetratricopeptide (TPR) repeat protein